MNVTGNKVTAINTGGCSSMRGADGNRLNTKAAKKRKDHKMI